MTQEKFNEQLIHRQNLYDKAEKLFRFNENLSLQVRPFVPCLYAEQWTRLLSVAQTPSSVVAMGILANFD